MVEVANEAILGALVGSEPRIVRLVWQAFECGIVCLLIRLG
jgi:hypothetical protein